MAIQMLAAYVASVLGWAQRDDEGQTMAEYGLILAGIAVLVMAAVWALGGVIDTTFDSVVTRFNGAGA